MAYQRVETDVAKIWERRRDNGVAVEICYEVHMKSIFAFRRCENSVERKRKDRVEVCEEDEVSRILRFPRVQCVSLTGRSKCNLARASTSTSTSLVSPSLSFRVQEVADKRTARLQHYGSRIEA